MVCLVVFALLCWVRKIEIFASTHVFADLMILLMLIYIVTMGIIYKNDDTTGHDVTELKPFYASGWATGFGFSIYSYEGIGIILPV